MELLGVIVLSSSLLGAFTLMALATLGCRRLRQQDLPVTALLYELGKRLLAKFTCPWCTCTWQTRRAEQQFQEALCKLLIRCCYCFLPFYIFRFGLIQYRYFMGIHHPTPASFDLSDLVLYTLILTWFVLGRKVITPRSLDAWTTLAFLVALPPVLLISDPRHASVLATRGFTLRFVCCLTAKNFWLPAALSVLNWLIVFYRMNDGNVNDDTGMEAVAHVAVVLLAYAMREQIWTNTCIGLELKSSTTALDSVSRLLRGFCDVVVELDDCLSLCGDVSNLATMLLHGKGMSASQDNRDFIGYFSPASREHVATQLRLDDGTTIPQALHATMLDSLANSLEVELLHIRFQDAEGHARRLVGVREFPDFAPVAPLPVDVEMSKLSSIDPKPILLFDAFTFDVLYVDTHIADRFAEPRDELAQLTLHRFLTYKDLARLQHVVNDCHLYNSESKPVADLDFRLLWGRIRCVRFEYDAVLSTWVGSLFLDITVQDLSGIASSNRSSRKPAGREERSAPSRISSPLSRASSLLGSRQGSVDELRAHATAAAMLSL